MLNKEKQVRPDIEGEIDEIQRFSQELSRDEGIEVSVDEVIKSLKKSQEQTLTDDLWNTLENTESNEVEEGDWKTVNRIARDYKKTSPKILKKEIESGEYKRPLIAKLGDRHILIAGNTRLCTAAAMGVNLNVFIAKIDVESDTIDETEKLKGGLADNKSLIKIAKKHDPKNHTQMIKLLNKQLEMGLKVEMEHTDDKNKAKEIALDHLSEDPNYYSKLKKIEAKESMGADSAGAFETKFGGVIRKKDLYNPNNFKKYNVNEDEEVTEIIDPGAYDTPFGDGGKNPLKINGEKSIKNSRAVKDKNFPKWGGPDSVFIKIKEKCKKFPYCNQGDINAIELLEIRDEIKEVSEKYGIPYKEMEKIVLNEINKIFIDMNIGDLNNLIESIALEEIRKTMISESKEVFHIKLNGEPIDTFSSKEEAEEALPKYKAKEKGELIIEPEMYESYEDYIDKLDEMGQELEEMENMEKEEPMEGDDFDFELDEEGMCYECNEEEMEEGKMGTCNECGTMLNEEGMCSECDSMKESTKKKKVLRLTESEMFEMIKKMVSESLPGLDVTNRVKKESKKYNEDNAKEVESKIKKATTIKGSDNSEFPHQNNGGTKVARQNDDNDDEFVQDNRGGTALNLDYDTEPSEKFQKRLKSALEGDSKMGNSQDAANVVKSDLGKKLAAQSDRKKKKEKDAPMYNKDAQPIKKVKPSMYDKDDQPVKEVNESTKISSTLINEEIERMKNMANYNKKTQ
jgi:hypothetical protein